MESPTTTTNKKHNSNFNLSNSLTIMDDYQPKSINIGFDSNDSKNSSSTPAILNTSNTSKQSSSLSHSNIKSTANNSNRLTTTSTSSLHSHIRSNSIDSVEVTLNKRDSLNEDETKDILNSHIEIREKEIERQTRLAEKDKKDSLFYVNLIKDLKEKLQCYIRDFYEDNEDYKVRKSLLIEKSTLLSAIESVNNSFTISSNNIGVGGDSSSSNDISLVSSNGVGNSLIRSLSSPSSTSFISNQNSLSFWEQQTSLTANNSNISNSSSQHKNDEKSNNSVSLLVSSYHNKDEELERVRSRASTESIRANYLKEKYQDLAQLVQEEKEHWSQISQKKRREVESKEREINRLLMVAESQKKKSMDITDQITKLKKSLSSISHIRANQTTVDIKKVNEKCSFESLTPSPNLYGSLGRVGISSPIPHHNSSNSLGSLGSSGSSGGIKSPNSSTTSPKNINNSPFNTDEKRDIILYDHLIEKKDEELKRVREIIDYETSKTQFLTNKVSELKLILEEESRQVELLQNQTVRDIREKEDAIIKVALRAHKERIKSNQLNDQIKKLTKAIQNPNSFRENNNNNNNSKEKDKKVKKSPELEPLGINFMEMGELKQFQDLSLNPYCDENILNNCCLGKVPITSLLSSSLNSSSFLNNSNNNLSSVSSPNFLSHVNINNNNNISLISSSPTISNFNSPKQMNSNNVNIINSNNSNSNNNNQNPILNSPSLIVRNQMNIVSSSINIPNGRVKLYSTGESPSNSTNILNSNQILSKSPRQQHAFNSYSTSPSNSNHTFIQNQTIVGSPSEVIMFKLREIERLTKETVHKEHELNQVKKIAEAERSRLCLLKDKYKELRSELLDRDTLYYEKYATKTY